MPQSLEQAIAKVPRGAWAVGVSGGADSVALLDLLRRRDDLSLHVVHLDHQTRGQASTDDAAFVARLCQEWNLPSTIELRSRIEPALADLPDNPSARYRAVRLALFAAAAQTHRLQGVILAHHADDQAETVFQRLLRSSGYAGLAGMASRAIVDGLTILRPLLESYRAELREHLKRHDIAWREDASNQSDDYQRNRVRRVLQGSAVLTPAMLGLSKACTELREGVRAAAPTLAGQFSAAELARLPGILAAESARRWLIDRGVPIDRIEPAVIERLLRMTRDAALAPRQQFPGSIRVRRRGGVIFADPAPGDGNAA